MTSSTRVAAAAAAAAAAASPVDTDTFARNTDPLVSRNAQAEFDLQI